MLNEQNREHRICSGRMTRCLSITIDKMKMIYFCFRTLLQATRDVDIVHEQRVKTSANKAVQFKFTKTKNA